MASIYKNGQYYIGGGGGALDTLTDVNITNPSDNQVLKYNATSEKWENGTGGGGGGADYPTGGTTGQALVKASDEDNDVEWGNEIPDLLTAEDLEDIEDAFKPNEPILPPIPQAMTAEDLQFIVDTYNPTMIEIKPLSPEDLQDIKDAFVINDMNN